MKTLHYRKCLSTLLSISLFLSLFTACSLVQSDGNIQPVWCYIIPTETESILVDEDGNEILKKQNLYLIAEHISPPSQYGANLVLQPSAFVVETDIPIDSFSLHFFDISSALYSTDGTLLQDFKPGIYKEGFGNYVLHTNALYYGEDYPLYDSVYFSNLIDATTGDILFEHVGVISFLDENMFAVFSDTWDLIAVVNKNGEPIADLSDLNIHNLIEKHGDYYIISSGDEGYYLLDKDFQIISSAYYLIQPNFENATYFIGIRYDEELQFPYFIIDVSTKEEFPVKSSTVYYDENVLLTQEKVNQEFGLMRTILYNHDGGIIATSSRAIFPIREENADAAKAFFIIGDDFDSITVIDENGTQLAYLGDIAIHSFTFLPAINCIDVSLSFAEETASLYYILDDSLTCLTPGDKATRFYDEGLPFYIFYHENTSFPNSPWRTGIADFENNIKIQNIAEVYSFSSTRLVIEKDGYVGLVDVEGNWVYKTPA